MSTVRCLSRRQPPPGPGDAFGGVAERERARDYLATRMQSPNGAPILSVVERELGQMTQRERVFLEIEMAEHAESCHTFEADYGPWSGR